MAPEFAAIIDQIRQGNADAVARLVREFEPEIRRAVRVHLHDSPMKRLFDSMDICQSVMANFLVRAMAGQFELDQPTKVLGLLVTMARNKLIDKARQQQGAQRHPGGKREDGSEVMGRIADPGPSPSQRMHGQELLEQIKKHLTAEEAILADFRVQGLEWPEIGVRMNAKPDSLRKTFTRAIERIQSQMNVDDMLG